MSETYKLINDDCVKVLETMKENSIDSIVTDPPYELGFMSKTWDSSGIAFQKDTWQKCLRVLKPGGYLLAFGGSRTFHRIAVAIEDAGFEIRDTIMWLYGSGFPKSMNISLMLDKREGLQGQRGIGGFNVGGIQEQNNRKAKLYIGSTTDGSKQKAYTDFKGDLAKQWQGWGTALKPSFEPIIVARKPFKGSLVDNVIEYGVGGINIDECRVDGETNRRMCGTTEKSGKTSFVLGAREETYTNQGRFPANTILTYDETDFDEVCGGFPVGGKNGSISKRYKINNQVYSDYGYCNTWNAYNDSGSASRYFYCAKASKKDREEGLEEFEAAKINDDRKKDADNTFQQGATLRKNTHPTVKPTELMQYLVRLVSPKGATILDPFMGSGSTGKAVAFENRERDAKYKFVGIEKEQEYYEISKTRIKWASSKYVYLYDDYDEYNDIDEHENSVRKRRLW